ncbi:SDR family NAD(P)-dependent oxidoreductase [Oenococcus sp. UCMA 16435]|nr:SDR family NAD(P)-dependent oxidoreductase [Oenococcus sp. UCMA 16435]MDI4583888.1 SDR family NAD(P)-dependent oxidoreductase [Oenococcus sp. UCMA 14587]
MSKKVWFITGASRGLGKALAVELLSQNYCVVMTARKSTSLKEFSNNENVLLLDLDVTNQQQVRQAVKKTIDKFGRIDYLVNNAGYGLFGSIEETNEADARALFETDFWGLSDLTRVVLPVMRKQKSGHFINVSSIGGLTTFPAFGYYHAVKFAVEGFSQSLAQQVNPLGIKVTLVEPGAFRTDWAGNSAVKESVKINDYQNTVGANIAASTRTVDSKPGNPALAAKAIVKAVTADPSPLHLVLGNDALANAHTQIDQELEDLDTWKDLSQHTDFGSEPFWK